MAIREASLQPREPGISGESLVFILHCISSSSPSRCTALLTAIQYPYDRTTTQVSATQQAGSEEEEMLAENSETADAEAGETRHTGMYLRHDPL